MAQPNEFAVPFTEGTFLRVTAFPVRTAAGEINMFAVLAVTNSALVLPDNSNNADNVYSAAEQWYDDRQLTAREREIAAHVATGQPSPLIAERLGISVHTVRRHTERVFTKLGVSSRAELARRIGHISSDSNRSSKDH